MLRKENGLQRQRRGGTGRNRCGMFARRACRNLSVSLRPAASGIPWELSSLYFIIDVFDLRVLPPPFRVGVDNLFQVTVTRRALSVRKLGFKRCSGISKLPPSRRPQFACGVFCLLKEA